MPNKNIHLQFDRFLAEKGVLNEKTPGYEKVHRFIDRGVHIYGGRNHRESDPYHNSIDNIRIWINGLINLNNFNHFMATDYLRCAYGHYCLDKVDRKYGNEYSWEEVFEMAFRLMKKNKWTNTHFKIRQGLFSR